MSGESFCSLLIVAFSLRKDSRKSKGSPFVRFVLLHSLLETKETSLQGFSLLSTYSIQEATVATLRGVPLFSTYCRILFKKRKKQTLGEFFESKVGSRVRGAN